MANSNIMTKDQLIAELDQIAISRQDWEQNAYQASNTILYETLGKCLTVLEKVSTSEGLQNHLAAQLKLKRITCNKNTSLETRVVRWVFGDCKNRAFLYASVLQIALSANLTGQGMAAWIESKGGLENISRAKGGDSPSSIRDERIKQATLHFKTADPICTIESEHEQLAPMPDETSQFSVALIRNDGSGKSEVVFGTNNPTLINAILANAGRGMKQTESDQADEAGTPAADDEDSSVAGTNVADGATNTDTEIESDLTNAGQETKTQDDAKPTENPIAPSIGKPRRCEKTLHVDFPLSVQKRLAGLVLGQSTKEGKTSDIPFLPKLFGQSSLPENQTS